MAAVAVLVYLEKVAESVARSESTPSKQGVVRTGSRNKSMVQNLGRKCQVKLFFSFSPFSTSQISDYVSHTFIYLLHVTPAYIHMSSLHQEHFNKRLSVVDIAVDVNHKKNKENLGYR